VADAARALDRRGHAAAPCLGERHPDVVPMGEAVQLVRLEQFGEFMIVDTRSYYTNSY
jgi:hypothetical protein